MPRAYLHRLKSQSKPRIECYKKALTLAIEKDGKLQEKEAFFGLERTSKWQVRRNMIIDNIEELIRRLISATDSVA